MADLTCADHIPSDIFDCIIVIATLHVIYDVQAAVRELHRILKPGGVLLATNYGITKVGRRLGVDDWGTYWFWTTQSTQRLFEEVFQPGHVTVEVHGNILAAIAAMHGLASDELKPHELDYCDPAFEVLITIRAVKPEG